MFFGVFMRVDVSCDVILNRLSELLQTKTDAELGGALGVASQTVSTWRNRNKVPYEQLVELSIKTGTTLDFLIFGKSPGLVASDKRIDLELFNEVKDALNGSKSELRGTGLEHLLEHIVDVYNSLSQCETESEKNRMLDAQIQLLNKILAPQIAKNLQDIAPHMTGESKSMIEADILKYKTLAELNEKTGESAVKQSISGSSHQIAGRDLVNKDNS